MSKNSEEVNAKYEIYNYIKENNLVEIKESPISKEPQIDFGYGSIIVEVLQNLNESIKENKKYDKNELFKLILKNVSSSKSFIKNLETLKNKEVMTLRVKNRAMYYLDIIFGDNETLSIYDAFNKCIKYQENYYYNV